MSKNYDNWDRLVGAVLHREKLIQLALSHSRSPSSRSSESSSNDFLDENKCWLVDPKALQIAWGDDSRYWNWTSHASSRSPEVAELKTVWWLDIRGKIDTRLLSPETTYAAFLVFKLAEGARGLEVANATIRFVKDEQEEHALQRATAVHLQPMKDTIGRVAVQRTNGWMEVEIGNFSFQDGYEGDVEARLLETTCTRKTGLIVEGIEFRQVYMEATFFPNKGLRNREGRRRGGFSKFTSSKVNESFAVDWEKFLIPDYPKIPLSSAYQDIFLDQSIWYYMLRTLQISRGAIPSNWRQKSDADSSIRRFSKVARLNHMRPLKIDEFLNAAFRVHEFFQELRVANTAGSTTRFSSDCTQNNVEERDKIVHTQMLGNKNGQNEIIRGDRQMEIEMGSSSFQDGYEGELETRTQGTTTGLMKIGPTIESNMLQAVHSETTLFTKNDLKKRRARGKGVSSILTSSKIDESFAVNWERFLMPDYQEMASPSIYRGLLPDARNGKICCMIGARGLQISWGDNPLHWKWKSQADSRFSEVAELTNVWWLEIRGKIDIKMLSPRTFYAASLVFRLNERSKLKVANTTIRFVDDETEKDAEKRAKVVKFQPSESRKGQDAVIRDDGWMEIEMGNFYLAEGDVGEVEARLLETAAWSKSGLIVEGIEFRPICTEVSDTLRKVQ